MVFLNLGQRLRLRAIVVDLLNREEHIRLMTLHEVLLQHDQLFPLRVRKRFEQDAINNAEKGGIHADAQCQSRDYYQRETRILCQHPEAIANVLKDTTHNAPIDNCSSAVIQTARALPIAKTSKSLKVFGQRSIANVSVVS